VQAIEEESSPPLNSEPTAYALLQQTVELLSRRCPPHMLEAAAHHDLVYLRPHLQEALGAIADIERRRDLTDEELARRRAFKMLLAESLL
jgi:hypothetical protein